MTPVHVVAPAIAGSIGSVKDGSRPRSGERSERSLDAAERSRKLEVGATSLQVRSHCPDALDSCIVTDTDKRGVSDPRDGGGAT